MASNKRWMSEREHFVILIHALLKGLYFLLLHCPLVGHLLFHPVIQGFYFLHERFLEELHPVVQGLRFLGVGRLEEVHPLLERPSVNCHLLLQGLLVLQHGVFNVVHGLGQLGDAINHGAQSKKGGNYYADYSGEGCSFGKSHYLPYRSLDLISAMQVECIILPKSLN